MHDELIVARGAQANAEGFRAIEAELRSQK